jgi:cold-inducible RNA-binding protein
MRIYVGNLPYDVTEDGLKQEFQAFGEVTSVNIITDKFSGRPKGFAFIEMSSKSESESAIEGMNGKVMGERTIVVNEARPRPDNRSGGSYDDRRSGGYGGGRDSRSGGGRQRRY